MTLKGVTSTFPLQWLGTRHADGMLDDIAGHIFRAPSMWRATPSDRGDIPGVIED